MNRIIISPEEYMNICAHYEPDRYFDGFIFDQYELVVHHKERNLKTIYKVKYSDGISYVTVRIIRRHDWMDYGFSFEEDEGTIVCYNDKGEAIGGFKDMNRKARIHFKGFISKNPSKEEQLMVDECFVISSIRQYIMNESYKRKVIVKETMTVESTKDFKDLKKKIKTQKVQRVQCLLSDIINYATVMGHKEIHCECWSVRGHFRHYKSGKVSWVNSYEKGTKRNTNSVKKNRVYTLNEGA